MSPLLWVAIGALVLLAGALITIRLLMNGQIFDWSVIKVDGKDVFVFDHYGSKLPKLFGASATTIGYKVCYRSYRIKDTPRVVGVAPIGRNLAAHEIFHVVDRERRGKFKYWKRVLWQTALHPFDHDARPYEQEAEWAAIPIQSGTFPGVDAQLYLNRFI